MTLKAVSAWARGFGRRVRISLKLLAFLPMLLVLFLLNPIWWLFVGIHVPIPRWVERGFDDGEF